jgi:hypothetical protein
MSRTHDITISSFDLDRLERELAAVTEQRDRLRYEREFFQSALNEQGDILTKVIEQRDRLAAALQGLRRHAPIMGSTGDYMQGQLDVLKSVERISDEALQSLNPNEL